MREMWELQVKLERQQIKRVKEIIAKRRFRAAYDLVLLREEAGESLARSGKFWTEQQALYPDLVGSAPSSSDERPPKRRRPRRRNPKP